MPTSAIATADSFARTSPGPGVVEVPLLLPAGLAAELEAAAARHGLTAARLVRRLLRGYLAAEAAARRPGRQAP